MNCTLILSKGLTTAERWWKDGRRIFRHAALQFVTGCFGTSARLTPFQHPITYCQLPRSFIRKFFILRQWIDKDVLKKIHPALTFELVGVRIWLSAKENALRNGRRSGVCEVSSLTFSLAVSNCPVKRLPNTMGAFSSCCLRTKI